MQQEHRDQTKEEREPAKDHFCPDALQHDGNSSASDCRLGDFLS